MPRIISIIIYTKWDSKIRRQNNQICKDLVTHLDCKHLFSIPLCSMHHIITVYTTKCKKYYKKEDRKNKVWMIIIFKFIIKFNGPCIATDHNCYQHDSSSCGFVNVQSLLPKVSFQISICKYHDKGESSPWCPHAPPMK